MCVGADSCQGPLPGAAAFSDFVFARVSRNFTRRIWIWHKKRHNGFCRNLHPRATTLTADHPGMNEGVYFQCLILWLKLRWYFSNFGFIILSFIEFTVECTFYFIQTYAHRSPPPSLSTHFSKIVARAVSREKSFDLLEMIRPRISWCLRSKSGKVCFAFH
jgi:hypothetical protein